MDRSRLYMHEEASEMKTVIQDSVPGYRLSPQQERLWSLRREDGAHFVSVCSVEIKGPMEAPALERAFALVLEENEILRTNIRSKKQEAAPLQIIRYDSAFVLEYRDLGELSNDAQEEEAQLLFEREYHREIDVESGEVLHACCLRLGEKRAVLVISVPNLILDQKGLENLVCELEQAYHAGERVIEDDSPQYADIAETLNEYVESGEFYEGQRFWSSKLSSETVASGMVRNKGPLDGSRFRPGIADLAIEAECLERIDELSREYGVSRADHLLACWKVLAYYRNEQPRELVTGTLFEGRGHEILEKAPGVFSQYLPLVQEVREQDSFLSLLKDTHDCFEETQKWQHYFNWKNCVRGGQSDGRYYSAWCFEYRERRLPQNKLEPTFHIKGCRHVGDRYEVKLSLEQVIETEGGGALKCELHYNSATMNTEEACLLAKQFVTVVKNCVLAPEQKLSDISLLDEDEKKRVLLEWSGTETDFPALPVHDLFDLQAILSPDSIALQFHDLHLSYSFLNHRADLLASSLLHLNLLPEDRVGLCLPRSPDLIIAMLAVLKAGAAYVPLDLSYPPDRLRFMIEDAGIRTLITQQSSLDTLGLTGQDVLCIDIDDALRQASNQPGADMGKLVASSASGGSLAYIMYTSGSTGRPKGVAVEHRSIVRLVKSTNYVEAGPTDIFLQLAPVSFDASTFEVWCSLLNGGRLVVYGGEAVTVEELGREVERERVSVLWLTAGLFTQVVEREAKRLRGVRQLLAGGDVLRVEDVRKAAGEMSGGVVINGYGPTENTTFSCCYRMGKEEAERLRQRVPIGVAVSNTRVYVLDDRMGAVGVGVEGELYVGGAGLARCYWGRAEMTAERFVPSEYGGRAGGRVYRTGDKVRWQAGGEIEFLGRADEQVKVRGYRVEPGEVEMELMRHERVKEAVVVARGDEGGDKRLVGYVVLEEEGRGKGVKGLREYLGKKVPGYMVPARIVEMREMPLTANGKVDRRGLPEPEGIREEGCYVGPQDAHQEIITGIWEEVLGIERVDINENFFEMGGHSLLATQVVSRVRSAFGVEVALREMFEEATVAGLAEKVKAAQSAGREVAPRVRRVERGGEQGLSFAQQRLWFIDQLEPDSSAYNISTALRVIGRLDFEALERTLSEIVRRHEVLRTTFSIVDGEPVQVISQSPGVMMLLIDLSALPEQEREQEVSRLVDQAAQEPFDLAAGPLIRVKLVRVAEQEHVLVVSMHHIISDGWSMGVLVREVSALYEAYLRGEPSPLEELPIQYADYAAWQRTWLDAGVLDEQMSYWRRQLGGAPTVLELPTDHPRPAMLSYRGAVVEVTLEVELAQRLKQMSRRQEVTLFMSMLAALGVVLHRYSGQSDIVVGTPIAGRNNKDIEGLIGFFVNTLALRLEVKAEQSFAELLRQVREVALGAYIHQDVPFEKLVEEIQPDRSLSHSPIFQVMLAVQNAPGGELTLGDATVEMIKAEAETAKFDLSLGVIEVKDGLKLIIEYSTDLYEQESARRVADHLSRVLEQVVEEEGKIISDIELPSEEEKRRLVVDWNDTTRDYPRDKCIHELFEQQVEITPDTVAVVCDDELLTYRELNRRANQLAHHLRTMEVATESPVGVCLDRSAEMVISLLAVLKAGGAYVPLDPTYPKERIAFMLKDAGAVAVITKQSIAADLPEVSAPVLVIDGQSAEIRTRSEQNPVNIAGRENLAYVIYTSGSTGKPKGVMIQHGSLVNYIWDAALAFNIAPGERVLQFSSISFDAAAEEIYPCLTRGATLILSTDSMLSSAATFVQRCRDLNVTVLDVPTVYWQHLVLELTAESLSEMGSVRVVIIGSEKALAQIVAQWQEKTDGRVQLINTYGPTETTIVATRCEVSSLIQTGAAPAEVPIGRAVANVKTYVLDEYLQPVPVGIPGELHIGGEGLARGYLNRPELAAEKFIPDLFSEAPGARLYKTNDLVRYRGDGAIEFLGRVDRQVKIRGYRIELGEIEEALRQHSAVLDAAVIAREVQPGDKRLAAYVVPDPVYVDLGDGASASELENKQETEWRAVFDDLYREIDPELQAGFYVKGWTSSYTDEPIPYEEVGEWMDQTVERVVSLGASRIYEIGAGGSGLMAIRMAPQSQKYWATDLSSHSLRLLRHQLSDLCIQLPQMSFSQRAADNFRGVDDASFDAVLIVSVAQYFPSIDYLMRVLEGAVRAVADGGHIFLGDVRSLPLLEHFHASVQLHKAAPGLSRKELQQRIQTAVLREKHLTVDPEFFIALKHHLPRITNVEILLERGRLHNELSKYRYDVILHVGEEQQPKKNLAWMNWSKEELTLERLHQMLVDSRPETLAIEQVPNSRLASDVRLLELLARAEELATADDLREALLESAAGGVDPEEIWSVGECLGYDAHISWPASRADGRYDVVLQRLSAKHLQSGRRDFIGIMKEDVIPQPWHKYANAPLQSMYVGKLGAILRTHLSHELPGYMIPASIIVLDELPKTKSGKIDRKLLPAPEQERPRTEEMSLGPDTTIEDMLVGIWEEVLGVEPVSIHENFFELGGHSLLATQVISRVRSAFGVEVALREMFEEATVAGLAEKVKTAQSADRESAPPVMRAVREGEIELSYAQQRLWFIDQLEPNSSAYNMSMGLRLRGELNKEALQWSLNEIVRRHEALRTSFPSRDGRPVQQIVSEMEVAIQQSDLRELSEAEREEEVRRVGRAEAEEPFDLGRGPLLRVKLMQVGEMEHVLIVSMHHIISDGWSMGVMVKEFARLYEAYVRGEEAGLEELEVQYADYAVWQREWLRGEELERQVGYWREQLRDVKQMELPTDFARVAGMSRRGERVSFELSEEVSRGLKEVSRREGVTPFMSLLAAFQIVLGLYARQDDVIVGIPVANRVRSELESLIGFFVNTLLVRAQWNAGSSLREVLLNVRETTLGALANQDLPFERLIEEFPRAAGSSHSPLLRAMLIFQNVPTPTIALPGLSLSPLDIITATPVRTDIDLYVHETEGGLSGFFVYDTDLYNRDTIEAINDSLVSCLNEMISNLETNVAQVAPPAPAQLPSLTHAFQSGTEIPLSYHQERIWFIDAFETGVVYPTSPVYHNVPIVLRFDGPVDRDLLEQSLNALITRHDVLRTSVVETNGNVRQVRTSHPALSIQLERLDEAGDLIFDREWMANFALRYASAPFSLGRDLPIRAVLITVNGEASILIIVLHHFIADRDSARILLRELAAIYTAEQNSSTPELSEVPFTYSDFSAWQRSLSERQLSPAWHYWRSQLSGNLKALELPLDRPRAAVHTYTTGWLGFEFDPNVIALIDDTAEYGFTRESLLLGCFVMLLYKYTAHDEVVIGTSDPHRTDSEIQATVGPFANLLVLRNYVGGNHTASSVLQQAAETLTAARANGLMPFDLLVQKLKPQVDMSRTALFDVLFQYENSTGEGLLFGQTLGEYVENNLGYGKYDLNVLLCGRAGELSATVVYNADLLDQSTVERMMRHYQKLIQTVCLDPSLTLDRIALLSETEEALQVFEWNETLAAYPESKTIHQLFDEQVASTPDRVAVKCGTDGLSYSELNRRANRLAHFLRSRGVKRESMVGVMLDRSADVIIATLGILKAGAAYLPLNPDYPFDRVQFMLYDGHVEHCIASARFTERLRAIVPDVFCFDQCQGEIDQHPAIAPAYLNGPADLAYCIYTSGSTGNPNGVMIQHRNVVRLMINDRAELQPTCSDVWTMFHSYSFDFSVWEMYGALLYGGTVIVVPDAVRKDPNLFADLLIDDAVTVLCQTPSYFYRLIETLLSGEYPTLPLKYIIFGAEALRPASLKEFKLAYPDVKLINMYGITETTVHVTYHEVSDTETMNPASIIGVPIPTTTVYLLDDGLNPVPIRVAGDIYVGGEGLARGYLNQPQLTATRFVPDGISGQFGARLYKAGDLARYNEEGTLEYLGRRDQQVKIRGYRIELGEIETALLNYPAVEHAVVSAREDVIGEKRLVGYVVSKAKGERFSISELRNYLKESLPEYMVPAVFVQLEQLPLTPNGKVDRKRLPKPELSAHQDSFSPPITPTQRTLALAWSQVLGLHRVGIHDNFFELGGDSILSIQVIARAREAGLHLSVRQMFDHQTIAELALAASSSALSQDGDEQGSVIGEAPLTPIQAAFFSWGLANPDHFNQSVMLEVGTDVDSDLLREAFEGLMTHHDALRMRYERAEEGWRQWCEGEAPSGLYERKDMRDVAEGERVVEMEEDAARQQASLSLSEGRMVKVVGYELGERLGRRLLVVIHHLVVDGVSWRILLEDLERGYGQRARGEEVRLGAKTSSYKRWGERIQEYARRAEVIKEEEYWRGVSREGVRKLPRDYEVSDDENLVGTGKVVSERLSQEQTKELLTKVPGVYHTQINDVLLLALWKVMSEWSGGDAALVDVEGHGREDVMEGVDVSRTVGWFTTIYPVVLRGKAEGEGWDAGEGLKGVKEDMRRVPSRGIGYGVLRYVSKDEEVVRRLEELGEAEVSFNYLGQVDRVLSGKGWLSAGRERVGRTTAPENQQRYLLEVSGIVADGRLQMSFRYSRKLHKQETIERIAGRYMRALGEIIEHCLSEGAGGYTPSDFPLAHMTQQQLDQAIGSGEGVEDIYALSPMQQGMLFHSLYEPETGVYFIQLGCRIEGSLSVEAFRKAWQQVIARHAILRTAFLWEGLDEPVQVVRRAVELPWRQEDWRGLSHQEQQQRWAELLKQDRKQGFDMSKAPLVRLCLVRMSEQGYYFAWSNHHIVLDGWCQQIVMKEVVELYEGYSRGEEVEEPSRRRAYRDYIEWLGGRDEREAERFWREELKGVAGATRLGIEQERREGEEAEEEYGEVRAEMSEQETREMERMSRSEQVTMNTMVQGAWGLVMSRYSGQEEVIFGATVSGRGVELEGIEEMVGLFINTLPVRVRVRGEQRVGEYLRELQRRQVEAREYEHSALVKVQGWSEMERGRGLFESIVVFENYPVDAAMRELANSSLKIDQVQGFEVTNYPITLTFIPGAVLRLKCPYDRRLFDEKSIERLIGHLKVVLQEMAAGPDRRLEEISMLTEAEQQQALSEWNQPATEYSQKAMYEPF